MERERGEAGIGVGGDRPGAVKDLGGKIHDEHGVGIFERHEPPGRRDLGGGILGVHATEESVAKGGGQHAGPGHVIILDRRPILRRMFGEGPGKAVEHGIDRHPVGRIVPIGLLAPRQQVVDAFNPLDPSRAVINEALESGQEVGVLLRPDRPLGKDCVEFRRNHLALASPEADLGHPGRPCLRRFQRRARRVVLLGHLDAVKQEPGAPGPEIGVEAAAGHQRPGLAGVAALDQPVDGGIKCVLAGS